ncbi:MAG: methyltransferase domain-containing protein [Algoriphagus sp.]|uniref:class I SAM-dependent methyltransferase n=1 Tax=Algoriphagus sp. TaxID=1872435 RepID=UPI002638302F|nr:methyltransferase domain-containing protein [Algoriphagus sp.]MDG1279652.1 methyltransferase domain-containing protein [Algoriphagus sp.]
MVLGSYSDKDFDALYPLKMRKLSGTHWTPVGIARKAISFFENSGCKSVLDLGSGLGKFCLIAADSSGIKISGIEQRENLVQLARKIAVNHQLSNLEFIHGDLISLDFRDFDGFYFFNSFEENINSKDPLDRQSNINSIQYEQHILALRAKFDACPIKTKIVTYCGEASEIPESYRLVQQSHKGKLRFWEKQI